MSRWRPALRMARRDLGRHKVRATLTFLLVALPVLVGTLAALTQYNHRWTGEQSAYEQFLDTDGSVTATEFTAVRPRPALQGVPQRASGAGERDLASVDVAALLPAGTKVAPGPLEVRAGLAVGGSAQILEVDLADPLTRDAVEITEGRAPAAPEEVAVSRPLGDELGVLPGSGRRLELTGGVSAEVVGVFDRVMGDRVPGLNLVATPDTAVPITAGFGDAPYQLVDLPTMSRAETRALWKDLAAHGVMFRPRDSVIHPAAWRIGSDEQPDEITPVLVGALCVLVGLLEVVLVVGAAFSVAARRQIRDLGLLSTNGGAPVDVRRVLLAQGLVLGVLSSAAGAAAGVAAFLLFAQRVARTVDVDLWTRDISWPAVLAVTLLGSVTAVVASLLPAWRMSAITPVDALSGRFPVRPGESRAHRPAFVLAGGGLLILLAGGWATAYAARQHPRWTDSAVTVAALGLLLLVAGAVWCAPYVVRRFAALGGALSLSGRYAFRDAGRHRFRTAAAVMALMITVAGTVLAGFAFRSAARSFDGDQAPRSVAVDLPEATPQAVEGATRTVGRIVHVDAIASSFSLNSPDGERGLEIRPNPNPVEQVDEASLRRLVRLDDAALEVFRAGGVLTTFPGTVRRGSALLVLPRGSGGAEKRTWRLPAAEVPRERGATPYVWPTYVSAETAARLGVKPGWGRLVAWTPEAVTQDQLDRLEIYGLHASSSDPERTRLGRLQYAGLGVAGLLTLLVVGIGVALAAAESRDDVATLAAVGAGPWQRRGFGAMHGLFLGLVGSALGVAVGVPAGLALTQVDGLPGVDMAWLPTVGTIAVVLALSWLAGGIVTPSKFRLTRRVA